MLLVDTSAWIDYLRGVDSRAKQAVREAVRAEDTSVVTSEPIAMELLAGARDEGQLRRLERLVNGLPGLGLDPALDYRSAAAIFRSARRAGTPVRNLADCLIAAIAIRHDVTLLHKDADFEVIGAMTSLRHESLRQHVVAPQA